MSSREDQQLEVSEMGVNQPGRLRGCSLRVRRGRRYLRTGRGHCVKCRPWAREVSTGNCWIRLVEALEFFARAVWGSKPCWGW